MSFNDLSFIPMDFKSRAKTLIINESDNLVSSFQVEVFDLKSLTF